MQYYYKFVFLKQLSIKFLLFALYINLFVSDAMTRDITLEEVGIDPIVMKVGL